jgi:hypothetical protein
MKKALLLFIGLSLKNQNELIAANVKLAGHATLPFNHHASQTYRT